MPLHYKGSGYPESTETRCNPALFIWHFFNHLKERIMSTKLANTQAEINKDKLMQDLRIVVADAEELLRATAGQAGEKVAAARERIQENLAAAKVRLAAAEEAVIASTKQAAKATDDYVHENPWRAVGIAAGVGLIIGMLISRGR
jgi:ElaB/YqjD/DUF883 family membrane-anchored ribosome-binding protein